MLFVYFVGVEINSLQKKSRSVLYKTKKYFVFCFFVRCNLVMHVNRQMEIIIEKSTKRQQILNIYCCSSHSK